MMQKLHLFGFIIIGLFALMGVLGLHSNASASDGLNAEEKATLKRVEAYLNNISTLQAEFMQIAPDGAVASGFMALQRPGGRMRWQYNPPVPVWMLSTGDFLIYVDEELEQVSYIPIDQTLAAFLARDTIRFDKDIRINSVQKGAGNIRVSLSLRSDPQQGALALEFSDSPLQLKKLLMTDQLEQITAVTLQNPRFGADIDPKILKFVDPSKKWGKRVKGR